MDRSVRQSVDPVRRRVHGPGVSVFGSPMFERAKSITDFYISTAQEQQSPFFIYCMYLPLL